MLLRQPVELGPVIRDQLVPLLGQPVLLRDQPVALLGGLTALNLALAELPFGLVQPASQARGGGCKKIKDDRQRPAKRLKA